jgi:hypothetical protein
LYELKVSEVIRQRFQLLYVSHDLHVILSHEILDVTLSAYRGPQDFNSFYREHLRGKIIRHVLKGRVSPKKMLGLFVQMTLGDRALYQGFSLTHVKVQVVVFLE